MRPRFSDRRVILVTASDTTTVLDPPVRRFFVFTGTGVWQWYNLGDARKYHVGTPFIFENASSEIVGVCSNNATLANASVWERVPPRWSICCTLLDSSTAEGVWSVIYYPNPLGKNGLFEHYDFLGVPATNNYIGQSGPVGVVSGGSITQYAAGDPTGRQGIASLNISTAGQWALLYNARYLTFAGGCRYFDMSVSRSNANAAANEFTSRLGYYDNIAGGGATNGAHFGNAFTAYGGDFWVTKTTSAATGLSTTNISAVVPRVFPNWDRLRIEVSSDAARVDFILNKALLYTHTTDIPLVPVGHIIETNKNVDNTARAIYVDDWEIGASPLTQR